MDQSEVLRFEQQEQITKITKLSQAIRIGASLRPQCIGFLFRHGESCALGAAWEGIGEKYVEFGSVCNEAYAHIYDALQDRFGNIVTDEAMTMNDNGMSREHIADRLEALGY